MPEDNKGKPESKDTQNFEELQSTINSLNEKIESTLTDFDTKFDSITERLENIPKPDDFKIKSPEEEGYVPKGWEPKDYNDFFKISEQLAEKKAQEKLDAYEEKSRKAQEEQRAMDEASNKVFDRQIADLEKSKRLPKVEDPNNLEDPGVVARKELFNLGLEYRSADLVAMANLRDKIKSIKPSGSEAPVGSSNRTTNTSTKRPDYGELHNKSIDELLADEMPDVYRR